MFGFLKAPCRGCLGSEADPYRSYFCGLSNALKHEYGHPARFLVNRDSAFLSLLTAAQTRWDPVPAMTTCCNPFATSRPIFQNDAPARYAAAVTVCGLIAKIRDDEVDHTGWRRVWMQRAGSMLEGWKQTAENTLREFDFPVQKVERCLLEQSQLEAEILKGTRSPMQSADPTSEAFGKIFEHSATISGTLENRHPLMLTGASLGNLIYWKDAQQDFEKDQQSGHFNPLASLNAKEPLLAETQRSAAETIKNQLSKLSLYRSTSLIEHILASSIEEHPSSDKKSNHNKSGIKRAKKKKKGRCIDYCDCDCCCDGCDCPCDCS